MVLKILGLGFLMNRGAYLRDPWNLLDFTIVVSGYIPKFFRSNSGVNLSGLRSLRVIRPLKTITSIRKLRSLVITIFNSIPYLLEIMVVLFFVFLIFAIAGLQLFSGFLLNKCFSMETGKTYYTGDGNPVLCGGIIDCPANFTCAKSLENPDFNISKFDDLLSSFLMVYITTTLEGWTALMGYVSYTFSILSVFYFLLVVFIGAFFLMNLTLAVITIKFNESQQNSKNEELMLKKHGTHHLTQLLMISSSYCRRRSFPGS
jgi:hypothetical protein